MQEQTTIQPDSKETIKVEVIKKRPIWQYFVFGIFLVCAIAVAGIYYITIVGVQSFSQAPFVIASAKLFNLPLARINGEKIFYQEYIDDRQALEKFFDNPPNGFQIPSDDELNQNIVSRLLIAQLIENLAVDYNVSITDEDLKQKKAILLSNFSSQKIAEEQIKTQYGLTLAEFEEKVLRPLMLEEKVRTAFLEKNYQPNNDIPDVEQWQASHILFKVNETTSDSLAKTQAQKILVRAKAGEDFAELAKEFGSDVTKDYGGDLGWFGKGEMVMEFEKAIFALQPNQVTSQLVKTKFGYHIIKLTGKRMVKDPQLVSADQLKFFESDLKNKIKNANIKIFADIQNPLLKFLDENNLSKASASSTSN